MIPRFQPVGDRAIRAEFGDEIRLSVQRRIRRFCAALEQDTPQGVLEWVPGYAVVTVYYEPESVDFAALCAALSQLARQRMDAAVQGAVVEIPVCYGGEYGPDLAEVAAAHRLTPAQVIRHHAARLYPVCFLGFLPGFPYLGGLSETLATPRRATPRPCVPAGSVGIAGGQTGIYPCETPGGWQIIGRTPRCLFDASRTPPALLAAGDRVRFVPITPREFREQVEEQRDAAY